MNIKVKFLALALSMLMLVPASVKADEGMWLLSLIGKNYDDMKQKGFKLTADDIYNINQSCIKDAIVGLGNAGSPFWHFCTAEIVSDKGLLTTNHHCGYGQIQEHSTVEHDYLRDGFWAYTMEEELPNPGLTASILVRVDDVTKEVLAALNDDMTEAERNKAIADVSKKISDKAKEGTNYEATVKSMFNGNQFFLFVHNIYKDVRLVGAPPSSMGKFGGDTDNWMWPRHTADFSMFRIYTAPDGSPAEYSKDNVPLKPKHHLPINIKGVEENDFAMIMGFPGTTNRFVTSYGLEEVMDITNKLRYEIRTQKINVWKAAMNADQAVKIKYASKYASCSNYWKYSNEQNKALKALNTIGVKQDIERRYNEWAKGKDAKYQNVLSEIEKMVTARKPYMAARTYLAEGLLSGPELPMMAFGIYNMLSQADEQTSVQDKQAILDEIMKEVKTFYKDYDQTLEEKTIATMFEYVYKNIEPEYCPEFLAEINKKYKGNFEKYAADAMKKSVFANEETFTKFMEKPNLKKLAKDPMVVAGLGAYVEYVAVAKKVKNAAPDMDRMQRLFVYGLLDMNGNKPIAPDANSTIRCTYGNCLAYEPRDGVYYSYYTTLDGVMEKEDPMNPEFIVPAKLKELWAAKDYGRYANKKGELPTCFITNNDITGGNSGSPVMNAEGHLIGLAFDGNSEAMSGDIDFEENMQRCINLDVRYMLFIIDKFAGAKNLINEMTIIE
ncbi:MAG: S46 family peptidase [Bacteroidales bacterium]|nr:S46 family peptidase [Bacteroidales bacterium]